MKPTNFEERVPKLSEEHIKQICRFTKIEYIEGDWQKWHAFAAFKWWHYKRLVERDELVRKIRSIEKRSKKKQRI